MLSRLTYTLRETWASFKRNVTLTVAAIITSAVSLLIFGLTLLIQHGFDNLLVKWEGGIEMIVNVRAQASDEQRAVILEYAIGFREHAHQRGSREMLQDIKRPRLVEDAILEGQAAQIGQHEIEAVARLGREIRRDVGAGQ